MKRIDLSQVTTARWIKAAVACVLYLLLVIWIGNYWLLIGLPIVADVYVTRIIPWGFWKRRKDGRKPSVIVEWIDAIIFALIAVYLINIFLFQNYKIPTSSLEKSLLVGDHLFVSKVSYGPRMPNAPIFFPMTQNTMPLLECKSYLEWPMWDYHRLAGFGSVERGDIVVFNFPAGDTVCIRMPNPDYYSLMLSEGSNYIAQHNEVLDGQTFTNVWERNHFITSYGRRRLEKAREALGDIVWRPVDKRDCYVKRCIATPGDTLEVRHNAIYINGQHVDDAPDVQHNYYITTNGVILNDKFYQNLGISDDDKMSGGIGPNYYLPLTAAKAEAVANMPSIVSVQIEDEPADSTGFSVFPYSSDYPWSRDNYGPIWMPQQGATISLTAENAVLYERIITSYEGHTLDVRNGQVYVDGAQTNEYTFGMNYYFMLGDNRHKSADSRYWGFVPEDHIVGKPLVVWLSLDPDKSGLGSIRWSRFFKIVR